MIVFADARFGLSTCIMMTLLSPFFRFIPRQVWLVVPFLSLSIFAAYGMITGTSSGPNDIAGRFASTAHIMTNLPIGTVLGYEAYGEFTADSGFAYTLTKFAIWGFVGLWATFVMLPCKHPRAWQFHSMMIIYLMLILIISNSFYSVKTAALMFFMLGTVNAVQFPASKSLWDRLFGKKEEGDKALSSET
jgi:putative polymerase